MKYFFPSILLFSSLAMAAPSKEAIYDCNHLMSDHVVKSLTLFKSCYGEKCFHEVEVYAENDGQMTTMKKRVVLENLHGGRIQVFANGNLRVKIDRVQFDGEYFKSFARIPEYGIHSFDWGCQDAK